MPDKDFCWRELLSRQKRFRVGTQSSVQVNVLKISEKIKIHEQNKLEIYIYQSFFYFYFLSTFSSNQRGCT